MADPMIPKDALEYLKKKSLKPAFSYRDVWNEEHASAFTVAKAMQTDVLQDMKDAVEAAIENGQTFRDFKNQLQPTLESKGWWGRRTMTDPVTGEILEAQLGSARRLRTIYETNIGQAYRAGAWERGQESDAHPYIMYRVGPSRNHREEHLAWDGLILPKDDPFWNTHAPKNGWGCKCYLRYLSRASYERYKTSGVPVPRRADGSGGGTIPVKTERPEIRYKTWVDKRSGRIERIPEGITPGFNWNPGSAGRPVSILDSALKKTQGHFPAQYDELARTLMRHQISERRHIDFIDAALSGKIDKRHLDPVGFLDRKTIAALAERGVTPTSNAISMEAGLVQSAKNARHGAKGEGLDITDWYRLTDFLIDGEIFEDGRDLVYLARKPGGFIKIVVNPDPLKGKSMHGSIFRGPTIATVYQPQGVEIDRIRALKKVR